MDIGPILTPYNDGRPQVLRNSGKPSDSCEIRDRLAAVPETLWDASSRRCVKHNRTSSCACEARRELLARDELL